MRTWSLLLALAAAPLAAQQPVTPPTPPTPRRPVPSVTIPPAVGDTSVFAALALPPGNDIRRPNGEPGPAYWQQRADYTISATLDTAAKALKGTVTIRYTNNSPDTLATLWLQMDQNLFRPGSIGSMLNAAGSRFGGAGFAGGFDIDGIVQLAAVRPPAGANRPRAVAPAPREVKSRVDDTMMEVDLAGPLAPGASTLLRIDYHFHSPEHGADRMGRDGSLYELAQWYPRMAVYDDVLGWNTDPYLGQGEFYLEYGNFDFHVTVPAGYIVAGTGVLQNPQEVLTAAQRQRLAAAARSDTTIQIVTEAELQSGEARPRQDGMLTWHFKAENVRDVAWAAAPDYLWDASSWDGTMAYSYYRPAAKSVWQEAARMARFSIREYSEQWFRYPYPQISVVEGPVSGMEYPMLAMESNDGGRENVYSVITHEIGHNWFPMIVGSNERRYAWMDEGFNTFINIHSEEAYFNRDDTRRHLAEARFVVQNDLQPTAQPMITPANRYINNSNLGTLAYLKPGMMLTVLRDKVLGPEVFNAAFREYISRWAFKHPQPADFIRTMNDVSGEDLSWFWREWIYTTAVNDQAVDNVTQRSQAGMNAARITLKNAGTMVMPVELTLTYADSTTEVLKYPVEIWYAGNTFTATLIGKQPIIAARVNADGEFFDANPGNDEWKAGN
ncbi:MAG: M1 family metallopeptidase [Gemmatimonadales bacterium]